MPTLPCDATDIPVATKNQTTTKIKIILLLNNNHKPILMEDLLVTADEDPMGDAIFAAMEDNFKTLLTTKEKSFITICVTLDVKMLDSAVRNSTGWASRVTFPISCADLSRAFCLDTVRFAKEEAVPNNHHKPTGNAPVIKTRIHAKMRDVDGGRNLVLVHLDK